MPTPLKALALGLVAGGAAYILLSLSRFTDDAGNIGVAIFVGLVAAGVIATGGLRPKT